MSLLTEFRKDTKTECPCCKVKIKPCPRCGEKGVIIGSCESTVYCDDTNCGIEMDYGHWCGKEKGIPAIHHVIAGWNERPLEN